MLMGLPDKWDACSRTISVQGKPSAFAYRGDTIAVGLGTSVELLDAITGAGTSALRGHTGTILSLTFSLDGTLLVSRSRDNTVKLWDIQTGGVIRTFSDHTSTVSSISISPDNATIALGTIDGSIRLWDVRTGKFHSITTRQKLKVNVVSFSPVDSRRLISTSWTGAIQQWDLDSKRVKEFPGEGYQADFQVGASYYEGYKVQLRASYYEHNGFYVEASYDEGYKVVDLAYASDGTRFVSCGGRAGRVRDSKSGELLYRLSGQNLSRCCFSPDGRFIACGGDATMDIWNASNQKAPPVTTLVGHSNVITFLDFSSSLISGSMDKSVKFWQSSGFLEETETVGRVAVPLRGLESIRSVNLFTEDNTVVTSDESGVVKTWDVTTGTHISSFSTPAEGPSDTHLEGDTLIIVWRSSRQKHYHIWDVYKGQLLRKFGIRSPDIRDIKISGDGSTIFGLTNTYIEALCAEGAEARRVELGGRSASNFFVRGSKVGINHSRGMGWDFGVSEVPSFGEFADRPRLDLVDQTRGSAVEPRWIEDTVTKRAVFHLPEKYLKPGTKVEWDGRHLLVWSKSGEVVVMDFDSVQRALDGIH